jgi:glutamate mutase epsilon subunit
MTHIESGESVQIDALNEAFQDIEKAINGLHFTQAYSYHKRPSLALLLSKRRTFTLSQETTADLQMVENFITIQEHLQKCSALLNEARNQLLGIGINGEKENYLQEED